MNLNADLGEGAGADEEILVCVDSANVACGAHAGSISIAIATALRCRQLGVEVGAHPGYDDHARFGRVEAALPVAEIEALVAYQVAGLAAVVPIAYVKPHGALYHRCQHDPAAADAVARVAKAHGVGLLGQPDFEILAAAIRAGIPAYREGYADRLMMPDGSLAPRTHPGAVLDPASAAKQAVRLAQSGRFDTICVHGDTKSAAETAAAVRQALRDAGLKPSSGPELSPSGAVIGELHELEDLSELEGLLATIWERPDDPPINTDLLRALAHSGNYVAGARVGRRLVGGLVGWLGMTAANELHLHSHILGVLAGVQVAGVGFELKQDQRRWCLERGVKTVEWTTDPLVRRNAYFNLTKLGAGASDYLVNFYGAMTDGLNAGEESDRLLITWELDSPRAKAATEGRVPKAEVGGLLRDGAVAILSVGPAGEPVAGKSSGTRVLICQVPEDIVALRHADPAVARAWRVALRKAMVEAFATGYRLSGATRAGWYVLER